MTVDDRSEQRPVFTLVLRLWRVDARDYPRAHHIQVTHVQTGEVMYFRTADSLAQHIDRLAQTTVNRSTDPIEFPQRSNHV
jgi:hypothetical protein